MTPDSKINRRDKINRLEVNRLKKMSGSLLMVPPALFMPAFIPGLAAVLLFAGFPHCALAQAAGGRLHVVSHVDVIPKFSDDTAKALQAYAVDSRKDAGALRLDVLVEAGRPNHFTLIELWESRAAYDAHIGKDHTRAFREKLHPWLGSPYDERLNEEVK